MQKPLKLLVMAVALVVAATPALASGNANFFLGQRALQTDLDEFDDLEDQSAFGAQVDFKTGDLPFSWVAGLHLSSKSEDVNFPGGAGEITVDIAELSFGLGWIFGSKNMHPYVGGGLTLQAGQVTIEQGSSEFDEDKTSPGLYVDGGIYWRLGSRFNLGVGARIVGGTDYEVEDSGGGEQSFDLDYGQGHIVLGWGWD